MRVGQCEKFIIFCRGGQQDRQYKWGPLMTRFTSILAIALLLSLHGGKAPAQETPEPVDYAIFMQVKTTPAWLALTPEERFAFLGAVIEPVVGGVSDVTFRFFDSEFFSAQVTDVILWETRDLSAYRMIIEKLRETPFWDTYFEVVQIIPSVENAYAAAYDQKPVGE